MEDQRRYFVFGSVLIEIVMPLLQNRIGIQCQNEGFDTFEKFLNKASVIHKLYHLRFKGGRCCKDTPNCVNCMFPPLRPNQWSLLYHENPVTHRCFCKYTAKPVQLVHIDITLASFILRNVCNLTTGEEDAIDVLRQFKNKYLSHSTTGKIEENEFKQIWSELKSCILQLDNSKADDLTRIARRPLDAPLMQKYHTELMELSEQIDNIRRMIGEACELLHELVDTEPVSNLLQRHTSVTHHMMFKYQTQINISSMCQTTSEFVAAGLLTDAGEIVIAAREDVNAIIIIKTDPLEIDYITVDGEPYDISVVDSSAVAVILPFDQCVKIYDIKEKLELRSFLLDDIFVKLTMVQNRFVLACVKNELVVIDELRERIQKIKTYVTPDDKIQGHDSRIYHTKYELKLLTCYRHNETKNSKMYDIRLDRKPQGLVNFHDGSVQVLLQDERINVVNISSDGRYFTHVDFEDCLECPLRKPRMISYSAASKKLIVANRKGVINIYRQAN